MRITNNMILHNAASNINSNKILVDKGENQMTTQTKIQRPSDDPVVAVRSLALQTRLSKINQYYETNIPDAEKWMDVTETALNNIIDNITDLKKYCVQGSTGTLKEEDRRTILQQLQSLQESVFAEGNADYAGRTVFTGFRTDKTLVFTDADSDKKYNITQELSANDFEKVKYFNKSVTVPANEDEIKSLGETQGTTVKNKLSKDDITIQDSSYKRLRLAYDNISAVDSITFTHTDAAGNTVKNIMQLVNMDNTKIPPLANATKNNTTGSYDPAYKTGVEQSGTKTIKSDNPLTEPSSQSFGYQQVNIVDNSSVTGKNGTTVKDADGNITTTQKNADGSVTVTKTDKNGGKTTTKTEPNGTVTTTVLAIDGSSTTTVTGMPDGSSVSSTKSAVGVVSSIVTAKDGTKSNNAIDYSVAALTDVTSKETDNHPAVIYVFENESDWAAWSSSTSSGATGEDALTKYVPDNAMVMIKETGDLIFGKSVSDQMSAKETTVAVNYDKNSFSAGELKPEYYYDCVDNTSVNYADLEGTIGQRQVYDRSKIHYDIDYTVAVNQDLTVNIQANEVFDSNVQQDMKDLTAAITNTQNADSKRQKIQALMKDADYQDETTQAKLSEWYTAANMEYDYYKDYMQDTFERVLGNCDTYLNKANLGETTLSCRGDELQMTKLRMDEQQESVTDLKNKNDNMDLSTIMMNYTAYYTAYQASLVAAGKLGQQSLLNYI